MTKATDQIRQLLDVIDGVAPPAADVATVPPGMILVRPNGFNANGAAHLWPMPQPEQGENGLGYCIRVSNMINPATGQPYFPPQVLGTLFLGTPKASNFAEMADKFLFPELWWDQAEAERQKAMHDHDVETGARFSPY